MIHGDLFREKRCPLLNSKIDKTCENPYGQRYLDLHTKFERLKENILETYPEIIENIQICWSCDWQEKKKNELKDFISSLSLPPRYRLIPRDGVRGGRTDTFSTIKDASETEQIFYKDASNKKLLGTYLPNLLKRFLYFTDSLYPYCALKNSYVLGTPEVIIGHRLKDFKWGENALFLKDANGKLCEVEGLLLVRVVLPRKVAPNLRGIPFLSTKFRGKSISAECNLCLLNDNRQRLCQHDDMERSFVNVWTIHELVRKNFGTFLSKYLFSFLSIFRSTQNLLAMKYYRYLKDMSIIKKILYYNHTCYFWQDVSLFTKVFLPLTLPN